MCTNVPTHLGQGWTWEKRELGARFSQEGLALFSTPAFMRGSGSDSIWLSLPVTRYLKQAIWEALRVGPSPTPPLSLSLYIAVSLPETSRLVQVRRGSWAGTWGQRIRFNPVPHLLS